MTERNTVALKVFPSKTDEDHLRVTLIQSGDSVIITTKRSVASGSGQKGWNRVASTSLALHRQCKGLLCV